MIIIYLYYFMCVLLMVNNKFIKFRIYFKSLNFYSMPEPILFVFRKRLNLVFIAIIILLTTLFSVF